MSYDIQLVDPVNKETLILDSLHQIKGGTYALGGTSECSLNVTYNYGEIFSRVLPEVARPEFSGGYERGIRALYGMTGADSIPVLESAISQLGDDTDPDYWKATEGNAKRALCGLLALAKLRPDGVWNGD